jgi:hypothetical protein
MQQLIDRARAGAPSLGNGASATMAGTASVQVQQGQVRATPSFLGKIVANLKYGDKVQVLQTQEPWAKVSAPGGVGGWMHLSALTEKDVQLKAGSAEAKTSATSDELALAGKGFNAQVEKEYQQKNKVDFTWIDRMVDDTVTPEEMQAFLLAGDVTPEGGAL